MGLNLDEPWSWTESDLLQLIDDQVTESLTLDYKASGALKKADKEKRDVSKDVASFANSAGGVIVYGVVEKDHLPTTIDAGLDPADISREWLENVIQSTIQRKIDGVRINQVLLATTSPGRVAYVVSVPASDRAPHMSSDNRYYKRYNFQSVPMEDYEVRDVANRRSSPDLSCVLLLQTPTLTWDETSGRSSEVRVDVGVRNESPAPAEYWTSKLFLDQRCALTVPPEGYRASGVAEATILYDKVSLAVYSKNHGLPGAMPIWKGSNFQIAVLRFTIPSGNDVYCLGWSADVSGAEQRHGFMLMHVKGHSVVLVPS